MFSPSRHRPACVAVAAALALGAATPVVTSAQDLPQPSVTAPASADDVVTQKLSSISPMLAAATRWHKASDDNGEAVANDVTIDVPWSDSQVTADRMSIQNGQITLARIRLHNDRGTFTADQIEGPASAFKTLAAFGFDSGQPDSAAGPGNAIGTLTVSGFHLAAKTRQRGDARFTSSWSGRSLKVGSLRCLTLNPPSTACDILGLTSLSAETLDARSRFAGQAHLRIGSLSLAIDGGGASNWFDPSKLASSFVRPLDGKGDAISARFAVNDLHLSASRDDGASPAGNPARITIESAAFSARRSASGALDIKAKLQSAFSPNVAKGTPLWPDLAATAKPADTSSGNMLPFSGDLAVAYDGGHLALSRLTADVAGLFDLDGSVDAKGLSAVIDKHPSGDGADGQRRLAALMGIGIQSFSFVMHDHGLSDLVQKAFGASPAELVRQAAGLPRSSDPDAQNPDAQNKDKAATTNLMGLLTGGGDAKTGLKTIVKSVVVERTADILDQLAKKGVVELKCTSTPACIALAGNWNG